MAKKIPTGAIAIVAVLMIIGFLYFFVIASTFAAKPNIAKPALASASDIGNAQINWLMNEVGAYKLHPYMLFGEASVIECVITDQNRTFTMTVADNHPATVGGAANSPDLRFSMNSADFMTLYVAPDTLAKAQEMRKSGQIKVDILKDEITLAAKGYKAIYDSLPA
jgi:hypothetical protein